MGRIKKPSTSLQVEWFYTTFHWDDRAEYVRSSCKLCKETLQTLTEYFETIYNAQKNNGTHWCHQLNRAWADVKCEMRHKLQEHYACKLRHFANHRKSDRSHSAQHDKGYLR